MQSAYNFCSRNLLLPFLTVKICSSKQNLALGTRTFAMLLHAFLIYLWAFSTLVVNLSFMYSHKEIDLKK